MLLFLTVKIDDSACISNSGECEKSFVKNGRNLCTNCELRNKYYGKVS